MCRRHPPNTAQGMAALVARFGAALRLSSVTPVGKSAGPFPLSARACGCSIASRVVGCPLRSFSGTAAAAAVAAAGSAPQHASTLRNVSFWGHIDAGKTTLTEKVLYQANALRPPESHPQNKTSSSLQAHPGHPRQLPGDVDTGSTVTDFLDAERQRGITIQSAAVGPFPWRCSVPSTGASSSDEVPREAHITLVDTPGHIDFTIEVERSLRVADGCVVLIDGVEGVESQTEGVWRIAQRYNVRSHIAFVNKLDRTGASLARSLRSIAAKGLHARPTLLQLPIVSRQEGASLTEEATLTGLLDLTSRPFIAHYYGGKAGEDVTSMPLSDAVKQGRASLHLAAEAQRAREHLVETVAGLDEPLLEMVLGIEAAEGEESPNAKIEAEPLRAAIRRLAIQGQILPVLCGSAQKGIGVQPVLDAISQYLPSPAEAGDFDAAAARNKISGCVWGEVDESKGRGSSRTGRQQVGATAGSGAEVEAGAAAQMSISLEDGQLSALAFKVVWDKRRGPMTFVRIYSGTLSRSCALLNTATNSRERMNKILFAYADRLVETDKLEAGQIGVLLGLRDTRTGDTLVDTRGASRSSPSAGKAPWTLHATSLALRRVDVPPPVFSLSLEPLGKADEGKLLEALDQLIRTDPSLHIDYGDSSGQGSSGGFGSVAASGGQMVLSGMGELHLDIAKDRLLNEFGGRAHIGNVRVSYRETAVRHSEDGEKDTKTKFKHVMERDVMGSVLKAGCQITLRTLTPEEAVSGAAMRWDGNIVDIDVQGTKQGLSEGMEAEAPGADAEHATPADLLDDEAMQRAVHSGLAAALSRGPISGSPLTGLYIRISNIKSYGPQLTPAKALSMMASDALRTALRERGAVIMEPIMNVTVQCDEEHLGKVAGDLTSQQAGTVEQVEHEHDVQAGQDSEDASAHVYTPPPFVEGLDDASTAVGGQALSHREHASGGHKCTIRATVPLVRLVQYSSQLRALTRGSATFEMMFRGFAVVAPERQREILTELGRM